MDTATFEQIAAKIRELTGYKSVFANLQLVSYDENTRHAVIQVSDFVNMTCIKTHYTHAVVAAFDSVLGVKTTVSCIADKSNRQSPHERFVM